MIKTFAWAFAPTCLATCVAACAHADPTAATGAELRLNDVQVVGSHNSYRRALPEPRLADLNRVRPGLGDSLAYDHPPLARQLDLGVRQLELDVFADPTGLWMAEGGAGFKVLHIAGLDEASHCRQLTTCLAEVRAWSEAHPGHLPLVITIDAKDYPAAIPGSRVPVPLDAGLLDGLDATLRAALGAERLITPDELRGGAASLRAAVLGTGWPPLAQARGRVLVVFDVRPELAELYRAGRPNLAGRAMFSVYPESAPEAAVFIVQDPRGREAEIAAWVRQGYLVRTRSDANTHEARRGDRSMLEAAVRSGAQVISTDYYPGAPDPLGLGFVVTLPGGGLARCNPVRQDPACRLPAEVAE